LYRELLRRQWQTTLAQHLGLPVQIQTVACGPAGAIRLIGLRIVDPERGATLAAARFVEVEQDGRGWVAMISAPRAALTCCRDQVRPHSPSRSWVSCRQLSVLPSDASSAAPDAGAAPDYSAAGFSRNACASSLRSKICGARPRLLRASFIFRRIKALVV